MHPDDLMREFDRLFAELSLPLTRHARRGSFNPNADVYLTDRGRTIIVRVELSGVNPANVKLVVEGANLYLAGFREPDINRAEAVIQKEIDYGCFLKRVALPSPVAVDEAKADYRGGTLTIKLPVSDSSQVESVDRTEIRMAVRARG